MRGGSERRAVEDLLHTSSLSGQELERALLERISAGQLCLRGSHLRSEDALGLRLVAAVCVNRTGPDLHRRRLTAGSEEHLTRVHVDDNAL